jgi:hypothetical protein
MAQTIPISNVEELYGAVNDPANAGATLVLSPGTYTLSATDGDGSVRPNGGRIELQPDMSLTGVVGDAGAVVLNFGPQTSGQVIDADIVDCQFFDNIFNLSEGVRLGNFQGARGSTVNVRMSGNASWGQKQGRLIVNNRAIGSTVSVISTGNRFYDNGGGTIVVGGLSSNNTRADDNAISLEMHGDRFFGNTRASEFDHGGLIVLASENISDASGASNNIVHVELWGTRMADNDVADLVAIGARSTAPSTGALSVNNQVTIEIHGDGDGNGQWQRLEFVADIVPAGPSYGNTAVLIPR